MKKIVFLVAAMSLMASSAFAFTASSAGQTVVGDGKILGKLSQGVTLSGTNDASGYAIITKHAKGKRTYGTSHDSTAIYSYEGTATAPSVSNSSAFGTGWTAM